MKWAVGVSIFVLRGMERVEWGFEALRGCVVAGICSVLLDLVFMFLSLGLLFGFECGFCGVLGRGDGYFVGCSGLVVIGVSLLGFLWALSVDFAEFSS